MSRTSRALASLALVVAVLTLSCTRSADPPGEADPPLAQLEQARARQQEVQSELLAMTGQALAARLGEESRRGTEPFNSPTYREAVRRGAEVGPELAAQVREADRSGLLALLALREVDRERYRTLGDGVSVSVLVDALRTSETFNIWGLPHLHWEDAAQATIELGEVARDPLVLLLDDKRDAPVWGSEEVAEYNTYRYRVCDYAWAMLMAIQGESIEIPVEPEARDSLINQIRSVG